MTRTGSYAPRTTKQSSCLPGQTPQSSWAAPTQPVRYVDLHTFWVITQQRRAGEARLSHGQDGITDTSRLPRRMWQVGDEQAAHAQMNRLGARIGRAFVFTGTHVVDHTTTGQCSGPCKCHLSLIWCVWLDVRHQYVARSVYSAAAAGELLT